MTMDNTKYINTSESDSGMFSVDQGALKTGHWTKPNGYRSNQGIFPHFFSENVTNTRYDIIEADCAMSESRSIKIGSRKNKTEMVEFVQTKRTNEPVEMTDSIPIEQFQNMSIQRPEPRKLVTVIQPGTSLKSVPDLSQTYEFTFEPESGFQSISEKPELQSEEYNIRLKRTMFYCQIIPADGESLLHNAIIAENESLALYMLEDMVTDKYLSVQNNFKQTPLHLAVMNNMPKVIRRIMAHGADVCVRNRKGDTPLHLACKHGLKDCVETLTRHLIYEDVKDIPYSVPFRLIPQDLELRNYDGLTCLHLAVIHGHFDIVNYLINEMYASVDTQEGKSGKTALHFAVEKGSESMVNFLVLTCGCNVNAEMYNRRTALDIAVEMRRLDLQRILINFGGRTADISSDEASDMDTNS